MFSGYLQAGICHRLDGHLRLPGWRWLFIFCGCISLPGPIWGLHAIPDNPYMTRVRWLKSEMLEKYVERMKRIDRRKPVLLSWKKLGVILGRWRIYIFTLMLMFVFPVL